MLLFPLLIFHFYSTLIVFEKEKQTKKKTENKSEESLKGGRASVFWVVVPVVVSNETGIFLRPYRSPDDIAEIRLRVNSLRTRTHKDLSYISSSSRFPFVCVFFSFNPPSTIVYVIQHSHNMLFRSRDS